MIDFVVVLLSYAISGKRTLEAAPASEVEAALLGLEKGAPLIRLESVSYTADGRPVEYFYALHRGDRSRFEIELVRTRGGVEEKTTKEDLTADGRG